MTRLNVNFLGTWRIFTILFSFGFTPSAISAPFTIEFFDDQAAFETRLLGATNLVDFEAIDTSSADPASFSSDFFKISDGITITGQGGQFASQDFLYSPSDYNPVSGVNMYAPGPQADINDPAPAGGNQTTVNFFDGSSAALSAGFGLYFIDPDFPDIAASGFSAFGADGIELESTGTISGNNADALFAGLVAIDLGTNMPIPLFSEIQITNGSGWPINENNEGVTLDDFIFGTPVAAVPEPSIIALFAAGLFGIGLARRRKHI